MYDFLGAFRSNYKYEFDYMYEIDLLPRPLDLITSTSLIMSITS